MRRFSASEAIKMVVISHSLTSLIAFKDNVSYVNFSELGSVGFIGAIFLQSIDSIPTRIDTQILIQSRFSI